MKLKDKIVIITGASSGIGRSSALLFAKEGASVIATARRKDRLDEIAETAKDFEGSITPIVGDMGKDEDLENIIDKTMEKFGRIDILVNNSGGPVPGSFRELSLDDFDEAYNSVLRYNINMIKLCLPYMEERKWGRIINITSMSVKEPMPTMVLSNIFRTAVVSFAKSISKEIMGKGITINNVCPGYFRTDRITELMEKESHDANVSPQEYEQEVMSSFPHKRFMSPDELGDMVAYLCSAQARSITGTTIQIDGGVNSGLF